ncbi:hypothetical protein [Paenibacillus sp. 481]|uniref:hypothetical protein n=1 Tax=Paenibacillus sp. 481 TaxID=2835869 RepID=UPI001E6434A2|nr:hypothetical protein [Paenibacillus sp. 481]UHA74473.1 hypothetical protein KIK04_05035 [Paenibacillus sp. 481]
MAKGEKIDELEVSASQLASLVGKSDVWIRKLNRDGIIKKSGKKYKLGDAIKAYLNHIEGESTDGKLSYRDIKAEHEQVKKEIAQLELEEKRGNLHTTADVQDAWGGLIVVFRSNLTSLPPKLANELSYMTDPKEIRVMLEKRVNLALFELSKYDPLKRDDS